MYMYDHTCVQRGTRRRSTRLRKYESITSLARSYDVTVSCHDPSVTHYLQPTTWFHTHVRKSRDDSVTRMVNAVSASCNESRERELIRLHVINETHHCEQSDSFNRCVRAVSGPWKFTWTSIHSIIVRFKHWNSHLHAKRNLWGIWGVSPNSRYKWYVLDSTNWIKSGVFISGDWSSTLTVVVAFYNASRAQALLDPSHQRHSHE